MRTLKPRGRVLRLPKAWRRANGALRRYSPRARTMLLELWKSNGSTNDPRELMVIVHHFETLQALRRPIG